MLDVSGARVRALARKYHWRYRLYSKPREFCKEDVDVYLKLRETTIKHRKKPVYTVKKLEPHHVLEVKRVAPGHKKQITSGPGVCYAVVDKSGSVAKTKDGHYMIFPRKHAATTQAKWMNRNL
jgi:hypothetical protein